MILADHDFAGPAGTTTPSAVRSEAHVQVRDRSGGLLKVDVEGEQRPGSGTLSTASPVKLWISDLVTSDMAGQVIGALTRKRIRHHGPWFDTRSADFSPRVRARMF